MDDVVSKLEKSTDALSTLKNWLGEIDHDSLLSLLPNSFITELGFFNFSNTNNPCFCTDKNLCIQDVNPTFSWAFGSLTKPRTCNLKDYLKQFTLPEEENWDDIFYAGKPWLGPGSKNIDPSRK